jgi:serine protease DegQ
VVDTASANPVKLGIKFLNFPPEIGAAMHRPDLKGAWIMSVEPGSIAQKADFRVGDVVTEYDGAAIHGTADLVAAAGGAKTGSSVVVKVARDTSDVELHPQF